MPYKKRPSMFWQHFSIFAWDVGLTLMMSSPARVKKGEVIYILDAVRGLNDWAKHRVLAGLVRLLFMVVIMQMPFPDGFSLILMGNIVLLAGIPAHFVSNVMYPSKPYKTKKELYVAAIKLSVISYVGFVIHGSLHWATFAIAAVNMSTMVAIFQGIIFTVLQQVTIFAIRSLIAQTIRSKKEAVWNAVSLVESGGTLSKNLHLCYTTIIRRPDYQDYEEGYEISQECFPHIQSALYGQATLFLTFTGSKSFFLLVTISSVVSQLVFKYVGNRLWKHKTMADWKAKMIAKSNEEGERGCCGDEDDDDDDDDVEYMDIEDAIPREFRSGFFEKPKPPTGASVRDLGKTTANLAEHIVHTGYVVETAADGIVKKIIRRMERLRHWRRKSRPLPLRKKVKLNPILESELRERFTERSSQIIASIVGNYVTIFTIFILCISFVAVDAIIPATDIRRCSKGLTRSEFFWRMMETFAVTAVADLVLLYAGKLQGIPVVVERMRYPMSSILAFAFMACCQACLIVMAVRGVTYDVNPNEKPCYASMLW
ncbi:hypothetical protein HDU97_002614 [Phlyctochytrium planicorne]|nr:hypothetical protein HDU97_002614 [Phlyctochytrium planicorne]